jgi:Tfp pilus assembly protein PilX
MSLTQKLLLLSTLSLATSACATAFNPAAAVRTRAANEFGCPEADVQVTDLGANSYKANACGNQATYACNNTGTCVKEGSSTLPEDPPRRND